MRTNKFQPRTRPSSFPQPRTRQECINYLHFANENVRQLETKLANAIKASASLKEADDIRKAMVPAYNRQAHFKNCLGSFPC